MKNLSMGEPCIKGGGDRLVHERAHFVSTRALHDGAMLSSVVVVAVVVVVVALDFVVLLFVVYFCCS